jgi:hypothetical protein
MKLALRDDKGNIESRIQNPEFRIQNPEFGIQNSEFRIQNSEFKIDYSKLYFDPFDCGRNRWNRKKEDYNA